MAFYDELKAEASALIAELGQDMTLVRPGATSGYDPVLGRPSTAADTLFPVKGILTSFKTGPGSDQANAKTQTRSAILQAVEQPAVGDRLQVGTEASWTVVDWEEVAPAGLALIYILQVQR